MITAKKLVLALLLSQVFPVPVVPAQEPAGARANQTPEHAGEGHGSSAKWPAIRPFHKSYWFHTPQDMYVHDFIRDASGARIYEIECSTPFTAQVKDSVFSWSGQFECRIGIPGARNLPESQLLVENHNADREWMSRGRFFANQLTGRCASYPEYGRARHFYLRRMAVTLLLSDIGLRQTGKDPSKDFKYDLRSFRLDIDVRPDNGAQRSVAGPSRYKEPAPVSASQPGAELKCDVRTDPS
ncbi:MAG TPA: hypothetical protein VLT16_01600 [Candidatus Limnocylindrales bacterium]|nr:hypothetical protein [Candidatus Limnocylindrales bacterium]